MRFRVAAGPGIGFGHLVRCRVLADVLGVEPRVSLRGSLETAARARQLGWRLADEPPRRLDANSCDLLIVDDPSSSHAAPWIRASRAAGVPVAAIRDAGIGPVDADLSIDGSAAFVAADIRADLHGPAFAILNPAIARRRRARPGFGRRPLVVITLGGGVHVRRHGPVIAHFVRLLNPTASVAIVQGFTGRPLPWLPSGCRWVSAPRGVASWIERASVAVVAGGMTVYEACALGTPTVALAVVPAQQAAIQALAAQEAVVDGGLATSFRTNRHAAWLVTQLLSRPKAAVRLAARARSLVDGQGAERVARRLERLALSHGRVPRAA